MHHQTRILMRGTDSLHRLDVTRYNLVEFIDKESADHLPEMPWGNRWQCPALSAGDDPSSMEHVMAKALHCTSLSPLAQPA